MAKFPGINLSRLKLPRQRTFQGPAAVWKRILAFVIDIMFIDLVLFWPFESMLGDAIPESYKGINGIKSMQEFFSASPELTRTLTIVTVMMGMLAILYFALMEYKIGQTVGKMMLNIYVVSEKKEGNGAMSFWQALLRSIIWLPMFPFIVFWIIDPLYIFLNRNGQRLLEYMSRTRTVENYAGL